MTISAQFRFVDLLGTCRVFQQFLELSDDVGLFLGVVGESLGTAREDVCRVKLLHQILVRDKSCQIQSKEMFEPDPTSNSG